MGHRYATVSATALLQHTPLICPRFLVDEFSDLYYDPSPLREYEKEGKAEDAEPTKVERQSMPPPELVGSPQIRRGPHSSSQGPPSIQFSNSSRHPSQIPPGMSFNNMPAVPAAQFYGNGDMGGPSPMRMGSMGVSMDPMMGGMGGMGSMGSMGGMGSLPGMGMGGMGSMPMGGGLGMPSPDMRRSMRPRGMSMGMGDDGFGGLH
jgi:hypothetical protein